MDLETQGESGISYARFVYDCPDLTTCCLNMANVFAIVGCDNLNYGTVFFALRTCPIAVHAFTLLFADFACMPNGFLLDA